MQGTKNMNVSEEAHAKIAEAHTFGESLADTLDRLLGITASSNSKKGIKK